MWLHTYISCCSFGLLKSQALTDSSKAEDLLAKCSGESDVDVCSSELQL